MSEFRDAAHRYLRAGLAVVALKPRSKEPLTRHGVKDATKDPAEVERIWGAVPNANVAIAAGVSNTVVLDVDDRHGGGDSLAELERKYKPLPETVRVKTPGGEHYYFRNPGGEVRGSIGKLGPGLDVIAGSRYAVAPPSVHPSGRPYVEDVPFGEVALAELPHGLLEELRLPPSLAPTATSSSNDDWLLTRSPREYVPLLAGVEVGRDGKALCPFHPDRTPSLHVYEEPGRGFYCFGCGKGGGIYQFAALLGGVPLPLRGCDFLSVQAALYDLYEERLVLT